MLNYSGAYGKSGDSSHTHTAKSGTRRHPDARTIIVEPTLLPCSQTGHLNSMM